MALKCDLREAHQDEEDGSNESKRPMIQYQQGLEVAQRIKALRYLGEQDLKSIFKKNFSKNTYMRNRMFSNEKPRGQ